MMIKNLKKLGVRPEPAPSSLSCSKGSFKFLISYSMFMPRPGICAIIAFDWEQLLQSFIFQFHVNFVPIYVIWLSTYSIAEA